MSFKKLLPAVVPLALMAFAIVPAMAQAAPEWLVCSEVAKGTGSFPTHSCIAGSGEKNFEWLVVGGAGAKVAVTTKGTLSLLALGKEVTCTVDDKGLIWNVGGVGQDEITEFVNLNCTGNACPTGTTTELIALRGGAVLGAANAWPSKLEVVGGVVRDKITEIEIDLSCSGTAVDTFTGTLTPKINATNGTAEFGEGSGELEDAATPKNKATVDGTDTVVQEANEWAVTAP
jgi:hypothetical protein